MTETPATLLYISADICEDIKGHNTGAKARKLGRNEKLGVTATVLAATDLNHGKCDYFALVSEINSSEDPLDRPSLCVAFFLFNMRAT